ncbi:class I adenylate cyclase, partial [bacterium]|nr:class I adenylate cyclase [bacterium]
EEFFGASLWQIYKGIDSPYKSVLKILLMEAYANEYPNIELLCFSLKRAIYENNTSLAEIDPYIMICHKVEEYLLQRMEIKRLELARRCFYFKTDIPLSKPAPKKSDNEWRRDLLSNLVQQWDWDDAHLLMLDSRPTWKIHRVLDERKSLVDELTRSYKLLSGFAREYASMAQINQHDMAILGRKLYAAFERKSGKIETINPGISENLIEEQLSFHESGNSWLLFRGTVKSTEIRHNTPLKRARSIVELLCWCHFNHLIGPGTITSLYTNSSRLGLRELKNILATLNQHFPTGKLPETDMSQLANQSQLTHSILFINVGIDSESKNLSRDVQVISDRTDAFSYSSFFDNLVLSIDQVSINTWQEVYSQSFIGINQVLDCLCRSIRMASITEQKLLPETRAYSFSSTKDSTVASRVDDIFDNVIRYFHRPDMPHGARYIIGVEDNYFLLRKNPDQVDYHRLGNFDDLLSELNEECASYRPTVFDDRTLTNHFLPLLYKNHQNEQIHIYIHNNGNKADLYIIDERGSLFIVHQEYYSMLSTVSQFDSFFYSIKQRLNASANKEDEYELRFFALHKNPNHWLLREHVVDPLASPVNPLHVTVLIDSIEEPLSYRVYCDDREFSSLEYGDAIFDHIAEFILTLRSDHTPYSLYISDIDIPSNT